MEARRSARHETDGNLQTLLQDSQRRIQTYPFPKSTIQQIAARSISTLYVVHPSNLGCSPEILVQIDRVDTGHAEYPSFLCRRKRHHIIKCSCSLQKDTASIHILSSHIVMRLLFGLLRALSMTSSTTTSLISRVTARLSVSLRFLLRMLRSSDGLTKRWMVR